MRARDIGGRQGGGDGRARTAYRLPSRKKHLTPFDLFIFSTWDDIIPIGISQSPFTRGRRHRSPHRRPLHTGLVARRVPNAVRGTRSPDLSLIVAARVQALPAGGEVGGGEMD